MPWNFCSSEAAIAEAGTNANTTIIASAATLALWSDQVEAAINTKTRKDWITSPPTSNFANVLADISAPLIANKIVKFDTGSYNDDSEAETILDVNIDTANRSLTLLKEEEYKKPIK
jgi:predicted ribosomally synthesized peptide with SipW-like signal peptide